MNMIQQYRSLGWATIRVHAASKRPVGDWKNRTDEPHQFAPGDNVGVRLGDPSGGLVDLDLDCQEAIDLAPEFMIPTLQFGRASKLRSHWIYYCPGLKTRKPPRTHVELRSTGGQTVFPPSIHETGQPIAWASASEIATVTEPVLTAAFAKLCAATVIARAWPSLTGEKHNAVLALSGALWHDGWTAEDAADLLLTAMELDGSSEPHREAAILDTWGEHDRERVGWPTVAEIFGPVETKALQRAIDSLRVDARYQLTQVAGMRPLTDLGNAERLSDDSGDDLRFVNGIGWHNWTGAVWSPGKEPIEQASACVRKLQQEGAEQHRPEIVKWGVMSESAPKLRAMLSIAETMDPIYAQPDDLDVDPWLLNCPNGVIDLRTGQLAEHDRAHLISKCTTVPYDPNANAPRFLDFLREIFRDDHDLIAYVLRFLGYSLTASTDEQVFQLWHGAGANGKSTLLDSVRWVLGSYAQMMAGDLLLERRNGRDSSSASPDIARLRGVRFASGIETKEGQRWNESLLKQLTSTEPIVARNLYRDPFEFQCRAKIVLAVNHKPVVRGTDHGIWRRIHLVPFDARFDGVNRDPGLLGKLKAEGPGILKWLVAACKEWQTDGLQPPKRVLVEIDAYRQGQDVIGQFFAECVIETPEGRVKSSTLYETYRRWATSAGEFCMGKHSFNNQLRDRGYLMIKSDVNYWHGFALGTVGL